jgi:hypothetical protein
MAKRFSEAEDEAKRFIEAHGDRALEQAQKSAKEARNRRDKKLAYHMTQVALHIQNKMQARQ